MTSETVLIRASAILSLNNSEDTQCLDKNVNTLMYAPNENRNIIALTEKEQ